MRKRFKDANKQAPIIGAIRCWAAMNRIESKELALAWGCGEAVVSRFLGGKSWPDGPTMGRIIAWLMGVKFHVDHCELAITSQENNLETSANKLNL